MITQEDFRKVFGEKKKMGRMQRAILEKYGCNPDVMTYSEIFWKYYELQKKYGKKKEQ